MFEPNLEHSKETYKRFHHSLSREKLTNLKNQSNSLISQNMSQLPNYPPKEKYMSNTDDRTL